MQSFRKIATLWMLGMVLVPSHWCCVVDWSRSASACCERMRVECLPRRELSATRPCCKVDSTGESQAESARLTCQAAGSPVQTCPCCNRLREAIIQKAKQWSSDGPGDFVGEVGPLLVAGDSRQPSPLQRSQLVSPPRRLQTTLCRWLC